MQRRRRRRADSARPGFFARALKRWWHSMRGALVALSAIGPFYPPPPPPPPPPMEERGDEGEPDDAR